MPVNRSEAELRVWLRDAIADLLEIDGDDIDPDRPLTELGISSRDAVGLVGDLEDFLDADLDATLVWQTPTISALALVLSGGGQPAPEAAAQIQDAPVAASVAPASGSFPDDAVAIIGLGCRLPGDVTSPASYWSLLSEAKDAVSAVPDGRWEDFVDPSTPGYRSVERVNRTGGFLGDVSGFDADHFGISPREAELMDPQQRMLLETVVEAMDHAGLRPEALRGSDTGVYVGISANEYSHLATADLARIDAWTATGSAFSIAANRISYLFDLRGPSMALDTACSSSLVAIHQACRSILAGESTTAFAAGVNVLLAPAITMTFDQAGALAPSGGSKPFSSDADGIARSEGVGVIVLKRLSAALADGDRVLAVVRASGVNQDGRSNGLTAPNPVAQEALLRSVYAGAGIDPATVDYVEAHGTGTLLGDPIEAAALGTALGAGRSDDRPLLLGSVKSNLGHLESAAGMAGVIKVVLGMQHGVIPASLKYAGPNPHIRFDDWHLQVVQEETAWPRYSGKALAGVSGFGFGGTNAHVVLEEWPGSPAETLPSDDRPVVVPLSAPVADRLRDRAGALAAWLTGEGADVPLAAVESTLTRRRGRALSATAIAARGRSGLIDALTAYAEGAEPAAMPVGSAALPIVPRTTATRPGTDRAVWVFSGYGSQWVGMGQQLLADEPAFSAAIDELEPLILAEAGFSIRAALAGEVTVEGVAATQIMLFSIQIGLAALWRSYGVQPAAVVGHSMGEVAAAVVAGGLGLADGVRVISARSRLLEGFERTGSGSMAVIELDANELARVAARFPDVNVCVYGSPSQLTVGSPDGAQMDGLLAYVESLGRNAWPLKLRNSGHSPGVEVILPDLRAALEGIRPLVPVVPFYSTAMEDPRASVTFDVDYWLTNVRQPVRFSQTITAVAQDGHAAYLELSPHPVTLTSIKQSVEGRIGSELLATGSLRRDGDDGVVFRSNAMALHLAGLTVDLEALIPVTQQADVRERTWRRRRFWVDRPSVAVPIAAVDGHPLLGVHVELPEGGRHLWRADIGTSRLPWLNAHQVFEVPVLPVAAYAEMALAAGREILAPGQDASAVKLTSLALSALMSLGEHTDVTTSLVLGSGGEATVEIYARQPGAPSTTAMVKHATVTVTRVADEPTGTDDLPIDLSAAEDGRPVDLYGVMRAAGHEYGPDFLGVSEARLTSDGVAVARVALPETVATSDHYGIHPVLLDICLQTLVVSGLALLDDPDGSADEFSGTILPVGVGSVRLFAALASGGGSGLATARLQRSGSGELTGSVRVVGDDGQLLLVVSDVRLRQIDADDVAVPLSQLLLSTVFEPVALPSADGDGGSADAGSWLLIDAAQDHAIAALLRSGPSLLAGPDWTAELESLLTAAGQSVQRVRPELAGSLAAGSGLAGDAQLILVTPALANDDNAVGSELGMSLAGELARLASELIEQLDAAGTQGSARVHVVSAGAVPVLDGEAGRPAVALLRGLVRTQAMRPHLTQAGLIDSDLVSSVSSELVARAGADAALDDEVAWRDGIRYARRLHQLTPADLGEPFAVRCGGYVVLGGLSAAGVQVARALADRLASAGAGAGSSRIVLAGPVPAAPSEAAAISALMTGSAVEIEVQIADSADADAVKRVVAAATTGDRPLRGLVQAPGGALTVAGDQQLARAERYAAWLLHELSIGHDLDLFVLSSSSSAMLGETPAGVEVGAWIDGLAQWRRARGLVATAVQWGDVTALDDGQIAAAFGLLGPDRTVLGVDRLTGDHRQTAATLPYFAALTGTAGGDDLDDAGSWPGADGLRAMSPGAARQALVDRLRNRVASVMGHRPEDVDITVPLSSLGVDSLVAMRAKHAVEQDVGVTMPVRLLLQGASLAELEAYLATELGIDAGAAPTAGAVSKADVEARDATERWLASAWAQVIGRVPASVTAPVSEFGSAEAARQVSALVLQRLAAQPGARERQEDWPAEEELLGAGTIEEQADLVRDLIENVGDSPMRVLSSGHPGVRPLFMFHPAGGTTSVFFPLVSQLDESIPVYGMERLGGLIDIDDKVRQYIDLIRQVQPHGPYRLGGWSFGGALSYRTAQYLQDAGEQVELLFMIDTILVRKDNDQSERDMLAGRFARFIEYIETTYEVSLEIDIDWLVSLEESEQIATMIRAAQESGANLSPALMEHQRTSYEDARIAEKFAPEAYGSGSVVLYRSTEGGLQTAIDPRYARSEDSLGWDVYCADLEVVRVPGSHTSMIDRPNVDVMAAHLSGRLLDLAADPAADLRDHLGAELRADLGAGLDEAVRHG